MEEGVGVGVGIGVQMLVTFSKPAAQAEQDEGPTAVHPSHLVSQARQACPNRYC